MEIEASTIEQSQEWVDRLTREAVAQSDSLRRMARVTIALAAAWGGSAMGVIALGIYVAWTWPASMADVTIHNWIHVGIMLFYLALNVWGFGMLGKAKRCLWQCETLALSGREILGMAQSAHSFLVGEATKQQRAANS